MAGQAGEDVLLVMGTHPELLLVDGRCGGRSVVAVIQCELKHEMKEGGIKGHTIFNFIMVY